MLVQKFRSAVNAEGSACAGAITGERYISLKAPPSIWVASCNLSIQYAAVLLLIIVFSRCLVASLPCYLVAFILLLPACRVHPNTSSVMNL